MSKVPQLVHTRKNRYSSVVYVASMVDVAIPNLKLRIFYPHRISCRVYVQSTLIDVSGSLYFILSFDHQYSNLLASLPILHILCSFPCVVSGSLYLLQSDDAEEISIQPIPIHTQFLYLLYTSGFWIFWIGVFTSEDWRSFVSRKSCSAVIWMGAGSRFRTYGSWVIHLRYTVLSPLPDILFYEFWVLKEMSPHHITRSLGGCCCSIQASMASFLTQLFFLLYYEIRMILYVMIYVRMYNMIIWWTEVWRHFFATI